MTLRKSTWHPNALMHYADSLWKTHVVAVARVIHSDLHQWTNESAICNEAENENRFGSQLFLALQCFA